MDKEQWKQLSKAEKLKKIEEVLDKDIRPMIEQDGGGVMVLDIDNEMDIHIEYQGACVGCMAATTSTLNAIQSILREKVCPSINVIPEL